MFLKDKLLEHPKPCVMCRVSLSSYEGIVKHVTVSLTSAAAGAARWSSVIIRLSPAHKVMPRERQSGQADAERSEDEGTGT